MSEKKSFKNSRLIQLISTLSVLEMKRFNRFLQSPYVTTNPDILKLFNLLKKFYPDFSTSKFNEQRIYQRLYGKEEAHKNKLQDLFFKLLRCLESYLLETYLDQHQQERAVLLTAAIGERTYLYNKQKTQKLTEELNHKKQWRTATDYYDLFQLNHNLWFHPETQKLTEDDSLLILSQENLDNAYLLHKLEFIAALSGRAKFLNTQSAGLLVKLKQQFLKNNPLFKNEYKLLFLEIIQLHELGDLTSYQSFKKHLLRVYPKLEPEYRKNFLLHLINFAINFNLREKSIPLQDIFELYQIGVAEKVLINNGKIRDIEFANICITGFRLGQDKWTNEFIEQYQTYLIDSEKAVLLPFVSAYEKLFNKDFEGVIETLKFLKPKQQLNYYPRIQALLIRAFFECVHHKIANYDLILNTYLTNFKKLMERNKKRNALKIDAYLNFIKIVNNLISLLKQPDDEKAFDNTKLLLSETSPLIFQSWLNEKLEEIKKATSPP